MGVSSFINLEILKNPLNWLTVLLMLTLAGIAGHLLLSYVGMEPTTTSTQK
jgi:nitrogen regulatory protein PII-like uncharacterized protein